MGGISLGLADYPWHEIVLCLPKQLVGDQPVLSLMLGEGWTILETILFPGQIPSCVHSWPVSFQYLGSLADRNFFWCWLFPFPGIFRSNNSMFLTTWGGGTVMNKWSLLNPSAKVGSSFPHLPHTTLFSLEVFLS